MDEEQGRKVVCVIQARMGSKRLPRKSMMPLAGKPLVDHVIMRLLRASSISQVVLAIPDTAEDQLLNERARVLGVPCYRGSENDLVDRFFRAAAAYKADVVVRVCADNPLIHPSEVDRIVEYFLNSEIHFASNVGPVMGNGYPDGLGAEVFGFDSLRWIHENVSDSHCREHVHDSFYLNKDRFTLGTVMCPQEFSQPEIVLDINTQQEYEFISKLFDDLQEGERLINIMDVIPWYKKHYHLIPDTYKRSRA